MDDIIASIERMSAKELDRLQEAIRRTRDEQRGSLVVERKSYLDGVLQLEYRRNPKTGTQRGPYWYYKWREGGRQRTRYIGQTEDPVWRVDELMGRTTKGAS